MTDRPFTTGRSRPAGRLRQPSLFESTSAGAVANAFDPARLTQAAAEHLAIVEALLAGDPNGAARAMARHIRSGVKYWSRALVGRRAASPANIEVRKKTERKPS